MNTPTTPEHDQNDTPRVLLTVEDAARQLSIGRTRMYDLIRTGDVFSVRIGRMRRVPTQALAAYVNRLTTDQLPAA